MSRKYCRTAGLVVVAALASSALLVPAMSQAKAKSYKIKMVSRNAKTSGIKISSDYSGKPFGKCKMKGTLRLPATDQVWKCKGGTIKMTNTGTVQGTQAVGTWKFTGGTGKFKGIKGKGKWTGPQATLVFTFTGTAKY